jgi:L-asparaginase II
VRATCGPSTGDARGQRRAAGHDRLRPGRSARGTDGCSIPTYAIPLRHLALAFARVATGPGPVARACARGAAPAPGGGAGAVLVAGSGRFDTRLMQHFGERVFCKVGAEGVYCAALPALGLGVAIKMDDGNTSARLRGGAGRPARAACCRLRTRRSRARPDAT